MPRSHGAGRSWKSAAARPTRSSDNGIDQLLPDEIELIHGPGCPVCVTPLEMIDRALAIAARPEVIFCSFGDMLRVPGSSEDLFRVKSARRRRPGRLLATRRPGAGPGEPRPGGGLLRHRLRDHRTGQRHDGVSGRAPGHQELLAAGLPRAGAAGHRGHHGVSVLPGPGFLAAGHVCSVMGTSQYPPLAEQLPGADRGHRLRAARHPRGHPPQRRAARVRAATRSRTPTPGPSPPRGTCPLRRMLEDVFEVTDRAWRGIGMIPGSGWRLSAAYADFDAELRFDGRRHSHRRVGHLSFRGGAPGPDQADRVRGVRPRVHAAQPARGARWCRPKGRVRPTTSIVASRCRSAAVMAEPDRGDADLDGWVCPASRSATRRSS